MLFLTQKQANKPMALLHSLKASQYNSFDGRINVSQLMTNHAPAIRSVTPALNLVATTSAISLFKFSHIIYLSRLIELQQ
jgi:hypothetical protein